MHKQAFAEVPPRVEYRLTEFGQRFSSVLDGVDELQGWLDGKVPRGANQQRAGRQ